MNKYRRGRRGEYKAKRILEENGWRVSRAAGSKGIWDLIAFRTPGWILVEGEAVLRFIQVKVGSPISKAEREEIEAAIVPPLTSKEVWRFIDRVKEPEITYL